MRDDLPTKPLYNESAIVNLDSRNNSGTHWVCYKKKGNNVEYFDSFGVEPPAEMVKYFGEKAQIAYNSEQIQKLNQIICGHLCLEWLYESYSKERNHWLQKTNAKSNANAAAKT